LNNQLRIVATDLACRRGERLLFSGLGFSILAGECLVLRGPNGSGKTTLLRAIAGFLPPEAGSIVIDGAGSDATVAESCHYLGHRDGLRGAMTVRENLVFAARLSGIQDLPEEAIRRLDLVRLADLPVAVLSAGQRRRAALARLLAAPRPVWLLDEPTTALDDASRATVAAIICEKVAGSGIVLAATHLDLGIAARVLELGSAP
jgi:heme exporter protein A